MEGEVIVAEGLIDPSSTEKFNVTKIHKPSALALKSNIDMSQLQNISYDEYKDKPLTIIIAKGPYSFTKQFNYSGLNDFLKAVERNRPHLVIMMGPFVDINNADISDGCIYYDNNGEKVFVTHEEIFEDMIKQVGESITD